MSFTHVQSAQNSTAGGTSVVITPPAAISANDLVVVALKFVNGPTSLNVTDNATTPNTYLSAYGPYYGAGFTCYQYYGVAVTGGATTITITWTGSTAARITIDEFTGNALTNAAVFDTAAANSGSTSPTSTTLAPRAAGELIVASVAITSATSVSAGTNYTIGFNNTSGSTEYNLYGSTSETVPMNIAGTSIQWSEIAGAYIPAPVTPHQFFTFGVGG